MNFYRRFPGDYARDTKHLTLAEHGAYTLLLDYYYSTEKPIPSLDFAYALCNSHRAETRRAVKNVLRAFFVKGDHGYSNKRAEEELKHLESRRESAKRSANARWHESERNANALETHTERNAIQTLDSRHQTPEPGNNGFSQDHTIVKSSSEKRIDDFKKSYLSKCQDPQGMIKAIVEIICERAILCGTDMQSEAYIAKAVENFDTQGGQDKEDLQYFLRRVPN